MSLADNNNLKPPAYHRQRLLMFLVEQAGGTLEKLDLQKLLFLYGQTSGRKHYQFIPYKFGCYSFLAADDVALLDKKGWLTISDNKVGLGVLLNKQPWAIGNTERQEMGRWLAKNRLRGKALIREVYRCYPYYATRSKMKGRLLNANELEQVNRAAEITGGTDPILFTLGYEGRYLEDYLNRLLQNGVKLLCDVRRIQLSRKFGFSKTALSNLLPKLDSAYCHLSELGIASENRKNLDSPMAYQTLFNDYRHSLPERKKELKKITNFLQEHGRVALTCFEREPHCCHRHCISDYLHEKYDTRVTHL